MSIYTKTGDHGETALFGGKRVLKCEELVDVYGSIDELNCWVGKITSSIDVSDVVEFLTHIQEDLFTIGGTIAGWKTDLSHIPVRVKEMEARIDAMDDNLPKLTNFVLPGGVPLASNIHLARAICRRVERQAVALRSSQEVDARILVYLNRLSDFLFILARFINHEAAVVELTWSGIDRTEKNK